MHERNCYTDSRSSIKQKDKYKETHAYHIMAKTVDKEMILKTSRENWLMCTRTTIELTADFLLKKKKCGPGSNEMAKLKSWGINT